MRRRNRKWHWGKEMREGRKRVEKEGTERGRERGKE